MQKTFKSRKSRYAITRKMRGGHLCSASNSLDKYTIGDKIGQGEEAEIYLDKDDPSIVIKKFESILITRNYRKKIGDIKNGLKISKLIGKLGIGPKVYYYKVCKQIVTVPVDNTTVGKRTRQILMARLFIDKMPSEEARLKQIKPTEGATFSYEAYIPYMVMEKLEGREMTDSDLNNPDIMGEVYNLYIRMYNHNIIHEDLHKGNVMICPDRIYLIDFTSAKRVVPDKMPNLLTPDEFRTQLESPEFHIPLNKEAAMQYSPLSASDFSYSSSI